MSGVSLCYKIVDVRGQANGELRHEAAKPGKISVWGEIGFVEIEPPVQFNLQSVSIQARLPMVFSRVAPGVRRVRSARAAPRVPATARRWTPGPEKAATFGIECQSISIAPLNSDCASSNRRANSAW